MQKEEFMYRLEDAPEILGNYNAYFVRYKVEHDERRFLHFLHHYEPVLNHTASSFLTQYQLSQDRLADLKQIFVSVLWDCLQSYCAEYSIPLLQIIRYPVHKQWHDYVRLNCGAMVIPEANTYKHIRAVARLYFKNVDSLSPAELIKHISAQTKLAEKKVIDYIETALCFRYVSSIEFDSNSDSDESNAIPEETIADSSIMSVFDTVMYLDRCTKYMQAAETLSPKDLKVLELSAGVCLTCMGTIPALTYEEIALLLGMADASGVEKRRKKLIPKFRQALAKSGYFPPDSFILT